MPFGKDGVNMFNNTKIKEMQKALDAAWSNPTPEQKQFQKLYFPNGKPTVDEFIRTVSNLVRQKGSNPN